MGSYIIPPFYSNVRLSKHSWFIIKENSPKSLFGFWGFVPLQTKFTADIESTDNFVQNFDYCIWPSKFEGYISESSTRKTEIHTNAWTSLVAQWVKNPAARQETWVWSLGWEDPLEKETATKFSILAWRIPWPGAFHRVAKSQTWLSGFHFHIDTDFFSKELAYVIVGSGWASLKSIGRTTGWKFISRSKECSWEAKLLLSRKLQSHS